MKKENILLTLEVLAMVAFVVFAIWFFVEGYESMSYVEEPVVEVTDVVDEVDTSALTDFVTDFYTKCESAEQFGIDFKHSVNFSDYETLMSECSSRVDNDMSSGHSVIIRPAFSMEVWYNLIEDEMFVSLSDSESDASTDWVPMNYAKCDGNVSEFIKQQSDFKSSIQTVEAILSFLTTQQDYKTLHVGECIKVTWNTNSDKLDFFNPMLGSTPIESYSITCLFDEESNTTVKLLLTAHYEENDYDIISESYEYILELTDEYFLEIPEIVRTKSSTISELEDLYNSIME